MFHRLPLGRRRSSHVPANPLCQTEKCAVGPHSVRHVCLRVSGAAPVLTRAGAGALQTWPGISRARRFMDFGIRQTSSQILRLLLAMRQSINISFSGSKSPHLREAVTSALPVTEKMDFSTALTVSVSIQRVTDIRSDG